MSVRTVFSGIIEFVSPILYVSDSDGQRSVWIRKPAGWRLRAGESVCVEGVCSTVQRLNRNGFEVIYMPETLRRSTFGDLDAGDAVNLERSLTLQSLIGGHLVQGHVDATARIVGARPEGSAKIYVFRTPNSVMRYIVEKGSVAIDGASLTVVDAGRDRFSVSVLGYTLGHTTLGRKGLGGRVNVEVDLLAKYAEKLLRSH